MPTMHYDLKIYSTYFVSHDAKFLVFPKFSRNFWVFSLYLKISGLFETLRIIKASITFLNQNVEKIRAN